MSRQSSLMPVCVLLACLSVSAAAQAKPEEVVFHSGKLELHGFLWRPNGPGPFPAVLWNHGSEKLPGSQPHLAEFYTSHFYVFFVPHRRGQGRSPGAYFQDLLDQTPPGARAQRVVELHDDEAGDVAAALDFLRSQAIVDPARIAISGCSYGGIQTLLAGERDPGVKALVPFAAAAKSWDSNPLLQERLLAAVGRAKAPVFLLQAKNDFSLAPSRALTKEAEKKHKDFQSKIYPEFGKDRQDGHWGFCTTGTDVWGADVLSFLAERLKGK